MGSRRPHRALAVLGLTAALAGLPGSAAAAPAPDPVALGAQLAAVTAHAQQLALALETAQAQDLALRQALEDLQEASDDAQERLSARVRELYIAAGPGGVPTWLRPGGGGALAARASAYGVQDEQQLVDEATGRSGRVQALRAQAERLRAGLQEQARAVLAEQDRARDLLAAAREAAARAAEQQARDAQAARLAAVQASLDAVSASVTRSLAVPTGGRGRRAAVQAEPVLALLAATGPGVPAGYRLSGQVQTGEASWYGPGFVGSPTASGRPYDPERLSCAHRTLPLGTVVHVSSGDRATNCLVDDRGPYAGDRVLDLSRAGSRALGFDGVAQVRIEVLAPT